MVSGFQKPPQSQRLVVPPAACVPASGRDCRVGHIVWAPSDEGQCSPETDAPYVQALSNQQKAVLMSERVMGIEHPNTIQEYVSSHLEIGVCGGGVDAWAHSDHHDPNHRCTWPCTALPVASCLQP